MYGTIFLLQDFSEFLQHYTKMHKANYTDQSIHIWSIDRAPVCSANYIQLQLSQCHNLRSALWPSINFTQTNFDNQINCPLNVTSSGCCKGLYRECNVYDVTQSRFTVGKGIQCVPKSILHKKSSNELPALSSYACDHAASPRKVANADAHDVMAMT